MANMLIEARERLQNEQTVWMATTRPDGRPHVAPIWFVWDDDRAYIMTGGVKLANVRHNGFAALNSEDGDNVAIIEGTARIVPIDDDRFEVIAQCFVAKYEWDIRDCEDGQQLIELTPVKTLVWNA